MDNQSNNDVSPTMDNFIRKEVLDYSTGNVSYSYATHKNSMQNRQKRLETFIGWEGILPSITPEILADNGFFYTGNKDIKDRVTCCDCGISLFDWQPTDNVEDEHHKHKPDCSTARERAVAKVDQRALTNAFRCGVCMETELLQFVVFIPCGHTACTTCVVHLTNCHLCRKPIEHKQRMFFA